GPEFPPVQDRGVSRRQEMKRSKGDLSFRARPRGTINRPARVRIAKGCASAQERVATSHTRRGASQTGQHFLIPCFATTSDQTWAARGLPGTLLAITIWHNQRG